MSDVRTRIAPSPTGPLHIGTARTALFNYLFAKKNGGVFVLRIEDTDVERSDPKYEEEIIDSFKWLGLAHDEGPDIGGPYGPYRQSERLAVYKKYLLKLLNDGNAFYCFHTETELEAERTEKMKKKEPIRHLCEWRDLPLEDAEKKRGSGEASILRFKIPAEPSNRQTTFSDRIHHQGHVFTGLLGDFSIAKSLDAPLYNFAVVIDDHEMKISHVIRGEDHFSNTPKQVLIAEALGWTTKNKEGDIVPPWEYAHVPLILGSDRSKLSKRHGATSLGEYRAMGYLPEALINFMALLGWNPGTEQELFSLQGLVEAFDIAHVQTSGAIFDVGKLDWLNGEYIRKKTPDELLFLAKKFLPNAAENYPDAYLKNVLTLEQPRLKKLSELEDKTGYFFAEPQYDPALLRWKGMTNEDLRVSIDKSIYLLSKVDPKNPTVQNLEDAFLREAEKEGDRGRLLWPLRVALSGKKASPGPFDILKILGTPESLKRLEKARKILAG